jgi:hypothetical protein
MKVKGCKLVVTRLFCICKGFSYDLYHGINRLLELEETERPETMYHTTTLVGLVCS